MSDNQDGSNKKVRYDLERRRVALPATMITLLILIAVGNEAINSNKGEESDSQKRLIATTRRWLGDTPETRKWEQKLAQNVSETDSREVASFGETPNSFDSLRYGYFEGKYSTQMVEGKLREIAFIENSSDRPRYIEDPIKFIKEQKTLFGIKFESIVEQKGRKPSGAFTVQRYFLKSPEDLTVGYVDFTTDEFGRFRELKVIPIDSSLE